MKIYKNPIFLFLLGIILSGTIVYAASNINASQISYNETTVETALNNLYTTANKFNESKVNYILDSGKYTAFTPILNSNAYSKFKISVTKSNEATCEMFAANVTTKQYDIIENTDYLTANNDEFSERRIYLSASNGWCVFYVTYHN